MNRIKFIEKLEKLCKNEEFDIRLVNQMNPEMQGDLDLHIFHKGEEVGLISDISIFAIPEEESDMFIEQAIKQIKLGMTK